MNDESLDCIAKNLTYSENGFVYIRPCLDISLFWSGSVIDHSKGVLDFYNRCLKALGSDFAYFRTESMTKARKIKKDTLELLPVWFEKTTLQRDIYMLFLENGAAPDEPSDRAFALDAAPDMGVVRLVLPIDYFNSDSFEAFTALVKELGQTFAFDFGTAGYSVNWNFLGKNQRGTSKALYAIAMRYKGVDIGTPFTTKHIVSKGIKCINWITLLSQTYCDGAGGRSTLRDNLDSEVVFHDLGENGLAIQAGPAPKIGDSNRRQNLPLYHEVGKALAAIRATDHPPMFGPSGIGNKEITEEWLGRFDS